MSKQVLPRIVLTGLVIAAVAIAIPFVVNALPVSAHDEPQGSEHRHETMQEKRDEAKTQQADRKAAAHTKLAEAKLKVCQNREKAINNIMGRLGDRGSKQLQVIGKISERTQTFYKEKGKTLTNYDALVADVTVKKAAAEAAVAKIKATSVTFACDGTDPKGAAASFKENLRAQHVAIKSYKTAVKNLIVGVKSVQGA